MKIHFNALTLQALIGEFLTYFDHLFRSCIVFPDLLESMFHPLVLRTFFHFFFQHKINVFARICLVTFTFHLENHFRRVLSKVAHQEVAQMV